jgi:hypothetical protein
MKTLSIGLLLAARLFAASPATWELSQFADFAKGKLRNVSISRDGALMPGPSIEAALATGESALWSVAADGKGNVFLGTGPKGRIFVQRQGAAKPELFGTLPAPHVFAMAVDAQGNLFAAGSPGGIVYQVSAGGTKPYANTGAKIVWSLMAAPAGLFAGADDGRVYRIVNGVAEVYFESSQGNITSLAADSSGAILAGSDPNGILYRIRAKNQAQVIYDAPFTEIRSVVPGTSGELYVLAMGGVAARRAATANQPSTVTGTSGVPQVTTTITVTEDAQAGIDLKPKAAAPSTVSATQPTPVVSSALDVPGLDRSAIYRCNPDGTVEPLFITKEESIFDIALLNGEVYFVSDNRGRFYRLDALRSPVLLLESGEPELGRILHTGKSWHALSTSNGNLLRLGLEPSFPAAFESPVHEAANIARWGAMQLTPAAAFRIETRSGNSGKPDNTWSAWQALDGVRMQSPAGRYAQWRFEARQPFLLRSAVLNYLPQNQPPAVKSITAALTMIAANSPKTAAQSSTSSVYTLTVTDTGEASSSSSAGTSSLLPTRPVTRNLMVSWVAEDPDSDTLQYTVQFRAEDEADWKPLKTELTDTSFNIDADTLADGRYLFRVAASDVLSNSAATARTADLVSVPVQLDQSAPSLEAALQQNSLRVKALDSASPIRRIEYAINAGKWQAMDASDGIYDSREESASAELTLAAGESIVTVRAYDASLNVSLKKLVVRR